MKKLFITLLTLLFSTALFALDISSDYQELYQRNSALEKKDLERLKGYDYFLVPGILAESFIWGDRRSSVDFSTLTRDYFSPQLSYLRNLGLEVNRLKASSRSVKETQSEIVKAIARSKARGRRVVFLTHSLGGLALLEKLIEMPRLQRQVAAVLFLQSPFKGSPISNIYLENPEYSRVLTPILPFLNTSIETLEFLSTPVRERFMSENTEKIRDLTSNVEVITVAGAVYGAKSLFKPTADLIMRGCIVEVVQERCLGPRIFMGPYDQNDGMVPVESSKLPGADFVVLERVDHGETIVNVPFSSLSKTRMTRTLLKLMLERLPPL